MIVVGLSYESNRIAIFFCSIGPYISLIYGYILLIVCSCTQLHFSPWNVLPARQPRCIKLLMNT
uniref:Uncharacterized protein n=1 Tax=Arundo donax TaxID=35708 RepID=A0A0A9E1L3_ARUDO